MRSRLCRRRTTCRWRNEKQLLAQISPNQLFATCLRHAAQIGGIIGLDPIEIVFGLRIGHAEHRIGIAFAMDVRNAPVVAGYSDAARLRLQARHLVFGKSGAKTDKDNRFSTATQARNRMATLNFAAACAIQLHLSRPKKRQD